MAFGRSRLGRSFFVRARCRSIFRRREIAAWSAIASSAAAIAAKVAATTAAATTTKVASTSVAAAMSARRTILVTRATRRRCVARFVLDCGCGKRDRLRRSEFGVRWVVGEERNSFDVGRLKTRDCGAGRGENLAALGLHLLGFLFDGGDDVVEVLDVFQEIADVEEGVAIEANLHKGRLHAWQHPRDFAFVDASD